MASYFAGTGAADSAGIGYPRMNYKRIILLSSMLIAAESFVFFDYDRVSDDFYNLKAFLNEVRYSAIKKHERLIVRFTGRQAVLLSFNGKRIGSIKSPTLFQVNYDTTIGDDMIVFTPDGTREHNTRIHGGDIRLKSWFGFRKNIAINCNGFVSEGVYPEER
jgi:hypothetical protein